MANSTPDPNQLTPQELKAQQKAVDSLTGNYQKEAKAVLQTAEGRRMMADYAKEQSFHMRNAADYLSEYRKDLTKSLELYKGLKGTFKETLENAYAKNAAGEAFTETLENNEKIQRDFGSLLAGEAQVMDDIALKRVMIGTGLRDEYAQTMATFMIENGITDSNDERVILLAKELKHRQEIKESLDKELELVEGLAKYQLDVREETEKLRKEYGLLGAKIKAIFTDKEFQKTFLKGLAIEKTIEQAKELGATFGEFRKEGLTMTQAFSETGVAVGAMFSLSGASLKENTEIMASMSDAMGNMSGITTDTVAEVGKLAKTFGVAAQDAGKLQGQLMNLPGATAESATNTMEFAGALAKAAHVAPGAVMKDMAQNAEEIAMNTKNGGKDMAVVAVAAHKLGVEMSTLTKMSAGLLDFENSINKQMEASVLLGREINLDKARELALNGDILGATQEMLKNVGGEAEFNKMNVVQRKALADSMGVSVSDLSKMVKNQDQLANLTEEQNQALADGSMTMDEVLANSGGVAKNLFNGAASMAGMVVGAVEMAKGLKDGVSMTKDLIGGFKEGSGVIGKIKGGITGAFGKKTPEVPPPPPPPPAPPGGGGLTNTMEKINPVKLIQGAAAMLIAAAALWVFAKAAQEFKDVGFDAIAKMAVSLLILVAAVSAMGAATPAVLYGAGAILILSVALYVLGKAIQEIAKGFDLFVPSLLLLAPMAFEIIALGAGMVLLGAGMLALGVASLVAFPGLLLASLGLGLMVPSLFILAKVAESGGLTALSQGLLSMSAAGPGLGLVALSMMGIGAGLSLVAIAGIAALPVIGALIALATVAPALVGLGAALGGMFGGEGGEKEEDPQLKNILTELKAMNNYLKVPGAVNMDGKKVGDVLRDAHAL